MKMESKELKAVYCEGSVCEVVDHEKITNEDRGKIHVDIPVDKMEGFNNMAVSSMVAEVFPELWKERKF